MANRFPFLDALGRLGRSLRRDVFTPQRRGQLNLLAGLCVATCLETGLLQMLVGGYALATAAKPLWARLRAPRGDGMLTAPLHSFDSKNASGVRVSILLAGQRRHVRKIINTQHLVQDLTAQYAGRAVPPGVARRLSRYFGDAARAASAVCVYAEVSRKHWLTGKEYTAYLRPLPHFNFLRMAFNGREWSKKGIGVVPALYLRAPPEIMKPA